MNELELKNARIEQLEGKWKKNVGKLQNELDISNNEKFNIQTSKISQTVIELQNRKGFSC
jgi:hypothetical protein